MKILLNGESQELTEEFTLQGLLQEFSLPTERIAIELNKEVVRKKDWEAITIKDGDVIEVVHFVGGG